MDFSLSNQGPCINTLGLGCNYVFRMMRNGSGKKHRISVGDEDMGNVMEEDMFCYIHEGGQLVKCVGGSVQYQGGRSESMVVSRHMSHSDFVSKLCDALHFDQNSIKLEFTVKFEPSCLLPLHDDATLLKDVSIQRNVLSRLCLIINTPSPIVGSNSTHLLPSGGDLPINICNDSLTIESYGFSHRRAETNILERDSRKSQMLLDLVPTVPPAPTTSPAVAIVQDIRRGGRAIQLRGLLTSPVKESVHLTSHHLGTKAPTFRRCSICDEMSLVTDSPVHSPSSDGFAAYLDAELDSDSSDVSPEQEARMTSRKLRMNLILSTRGSVLGV
ncbi:hypothetical protein CK203_036427 [Vitis vinifera]|uniref:Uncharacterized protein n=1 Tax=Vitis vinifera TaxID=29760 RepID=A0A438HYY6_VITVI|nr:hypothetical protein CK203_036427 [Vitis vinifera]